MNRSPHGSETVKASVDQEPLVDYLLGRMPDAARVALEIRLFDEGELDDQLLAVTDDLIHDYLSGGLSGEDRSRFESHFLAEPGNRERLAFIKSLVAAVHRL